MTETALRAIWCEAARYAAPHRLDIGDPKIGRLLDDANKLGAGHLGRAARDGRRHPAARPRRARCSCAPSPRPGQPGSSPTDSRQEDQLEKILANAGVEPLVRQRVLGGHEPIGRCDHRDRCLPLAVEVNSELHHTTPSDRAADVLRYQRLNDADFTVGVGLGAGPVAPPRVRRADHRPGPSNWPLQASASVLHSPGCPWPDPLPPEPPPRLSRSELRCSGGRMSRSAATFSPDPERRRLLGEGGGGAVAAAAGGAEAEDVAGAELEGDLVGEALGPRPRRRRAAASSPPAAPGRRRRGPTGGTPGAR